MGKMCRKHTYDEMRINNWFNLMVYHTMGTNLQYRPDEREAIFIRDREESGERDAFHRLHNRLEDAFNKTKYFRSYSGE